MSAKKSRTEMDVKDVIREFENAYDAALKDLGKFNLAIFGKTGVGKSTLINAIFSADIAKTGTGRPVTLKTEYFEHPSGYFSGSTTLKGSRSATSRQTMLAASSAPLRAERASNTFETLRRRSRTARGMEAPLAAAFLPSSLSPTFPTMPTPLTAVPGVGMRSIGSSSGVSSPISVSYATFPSRSMRRVMPVVEGTS